MGMPGRRIMSCEFCEKAISPQTLIEHLLYARL